MHKRLVFNIIAKIIVIAAFFMMTALFWAFKDNPHSLEVKAFIETISLMLVFSGSILYASKVEEVEFSSLNAKDGLAIVGLSWIILSAFGALPFEISQVVPNYTAAFFETVSGFTTTGSTVFTDIEVLPRGILFWRSMTHWLGGMGIIVLFLALLPTLSQNAFRMFKAESPGVSVERIAPTMKETAQKLWAVYFILSVLETIFLMLGGMSFFEALCHTFGTMATGGFSTRNASIGAFSPYIQWIVTIFMFLAGTNFILHYYAMRGRLKFYLKSEEFLYYLLLIISLTGIFTATLKTCNISTSPFREAAFQVVSILTTTGYCTANFDMWPQALRLSLVLIMFIGGCGGSTGGGMKVIRFFISLKVAFRAITQSVYPNAILPIRFDTKPCSDRLIIGVVSFFMIFVVLFACGTLAISITEQCDLVSAASASIACLSNIGPGLEKVGAIQNYAWISASGKWVLIFLMLAGRLELYSILILFLPSTWKK